MTKRLKAAMKQYFYNRRNKNQTEVDRACDIDYIIDALPGSCICFDDADDVLYLSWMKSKEDGGGMSLLGNCIVTMHSSRNYWKMVVCDNPPNEEVGITCKYSGDESDDFWKKINSIDDNDRQAAYAMGSMLRDLEVKVLMFINERIKEVSHD